MHGRDLKPENILLMSKGSDTDIRLGDFGYAKHVTLGSSGMKQMVGTLQYLAPEVLRGDEYTSKVTQSGALRAVCLMHHRCVTVQSFL